MPKIKSEYDDLDKYKNDYGDIVYYKKDTGELHNPYGPAFISKYGNKFYYINSKCHRLDGPARIYIDGKEFYYINNLNLSKGEFEYHPERLKFLRKEHLICLK